MAYLIQYEATRVRVANESVYWLIHFLFELSLWNIGADLLFINLCRLSSGYYHIIVACD